MNARFRSILLTASMITAAFSAVTYTSCSEDKCKPVVCANGSTCFEGACVCPSGYEGARCETRNRDRFRGVWSVSEDGSISASAEYTASIEPGNGITDVYFRNFNNFFAESVNARVKGDTIYIDPQEVENHNISGKGWIDIDRFYGENARLVLQYEVRKPNGQIDNYGLEPGSSNYSIWNK